MASFQTAVVYLLLLVALTSTILNLIRSGIRNLPRLALSLMVAQFTGIALAASRASKPFCCHTEPAQI